MIDRELYLPQSWTEDRDRCRKAGIGDEVEFATKPQQAIAMLVRAFDAGVAFAWVTADEAYGQAAYFRVWLEDRDATHVLACKSNDTLITTDARQARAAELIAALPAQAWRRYSAGPGAHGERIYDWARVPIRIAWQHGRGHWLLARRSTNTGELAYYVCCGPRTSSLADLARVAGTRWHVEECFQQAKSEAGLDHYQVRDYRAWYAHITLSMLTLAWLAVTRAALDETTLEETEKGAPIPAVMA